MYDNRSCRHTLQKDTYALPPGSSIIRSYACTGVSPNRLYVYFGTTAGELVVLRTDTKVSIYYIYLCLYIQCKRKYICIYIIYTKVFRTAIPVCSHGVLCLTVMTDGSILCGGGDCSVTLVMGEDKIWQTQALVRLLCLTMLYILYYEVCIFAYLYVVYFLLCLGLA